MNQQEILLKIFEFAILVFSLSLHEASHAWMASRLGDPTARMLGRVTLNPIKHIDPVGTILIPLVMLFLPGYGQFLVGWAKPTPVTTRNFKNVRRDDILTTLAGPCSNLLAVIVASIALIVLAKATPVGGMVVHQVIGGMVDPDVMAAHPALFPSATILYLAIMVNLLLTFFNLLPLPPLDGSHIFRYMLPYNAQRYYDSMGMISLILMLFLGGPIVMFFVRPALGVVRAILLSI